MGGRWFAYLFVTFNIKPIDRFRRQCGMIAVCIIRWKKERKRNTLEITLPQPHGKKSKEQECQGPRKQEVKMSSSLHKSTGAKRGSLREEAGQKQSR